jgi:dCMP deaminase
MLIDSERNVIIADGYNGAPRGAPGSLCAGHYCEREGVKSGTLMEKGCHHAEMNVICNAAAQGASTLNKTLIVTGEPCLMCAKLIHHAGIIRVILVAGGYLGGATGVDYLKRNNIEVITTTGPQDPRFDT